MLTANGSTSPAKELSKRGTRALFAALGLAHLAILVTYLAMY